MMSIEQQRATTPRGCLKTKKNKTTKLPTYVPARPPHIFISLAVCLYSSSFYYFCVRGNIIESTSPEICLTGFFQHSLPTHREKEMAEKKETERKRKRKELSSQSVRETSVCCAGGVLNISKFKKKSIQQFQPSVTCVFLYLMWVGDLLLIAGRPSCFKSMANNIGQPFSIVSIKTNEFDCCSGRCCWHWHHLYYYVTSCSALLNWSGEWLSFSLVFIFYNRLWQNKLLDCWDF